VAGDTFLVPERRGPWLSTSFAAKRHTQTSQPLYKLAHMSILTARELDFLASLRTSWRRLYWSEVARLLREGDTSAAQRAVPSIDPPCRPWNVFTLHWAAKS
jgi:hypothetical protein